MCETEYERAQHFFLYVCVCLCLYVPGRLPWLTHMAAICEVSAVELGREKVLREGEHMERGKSEMSCSTSWNVSPAFY